MSIQTLYRAQCQPCERYFTTQVGQSSSATSDTRYADLFIDFSSAYDEAVRRGWSSYPLLCPDCAADLKKRVREGDGGGVPSSHDTEDDPRIP